MNQTPRSSAPAVIARGLRRRDFLSLMGLTGAGLGLAGLAACGSDGGGRSSGGSTTGAIQYITTQTDKGTQAAEQAQFDDFFAQHSGLTVDIQALGSTQVVERLTQLVGAGSPPDLAEIDSGDAATLALQGHLEPVTDLVKQAGDVDPQYRLRLKGEDYLLPAALATNMTFYRKDLFDKAGVQAPTTWDEVTKLLPTLKAANSSIFPNVMVTNGGVGYLPREFYTHLLNNGGRFWEWKDGAWRIALGDDDVRAKAAEVLEYFKTRMQYSPETGSFTYSDVNDAFATGKVAMVDYPGPRTLQYLQQVAPKLVDVTGTVNLPYRVAQVPLNTTQGFVVFKNGALSRDLIKQLALHMVSGKGYLDKLWTVPGMIVPPYREIRTGDWKANAFLQSRPDVMKVIEENFDGTQAPVTTMYGSSPDATTPNIAADVLFKGTVYGKLCHDYLVEGKGASEVIDTAVAAMSKVQESTAG